MAAPLKIIGVINPFVAMMAEELGAKALYVSGAAVANYEWGLSDLGLTTLDEVANVVFRIRTVTSLPILVDIDTGWGNELMIERVIRFMIQSGASAIHIEDQVQAKRCGHREGKKVVSIQEMQSRLEAAIEARREHPLLIGARTDAFESEGLKGVITRAKAYKKADFIFPDALPSLSDFLTLKKKTGLKILINQTEFGKTPLYPWKKLKPLDYVLYPVSLARGMNFQAKKILERVIEKGEVGDLVQEMQPRSELYKFLDYEKSERRSSHGS